MYIQSTNIIFILTISVRKIKSAIRPLKNQQVMLRIDFQRPSIKHEQTFVRTCSNRIAATCIPEHNNIYLKNHFVACKSHHRQSTRSPINVIGLCPLGAEIPFTSRQTEHLRENHTGETPKQTQTKLLYPRRASKMIYLVAECS